jgi:Zn-dependent M28 family amino/carboxypeptidase
MKSKLVPLLALATALTLAVAVSARSPSRPAPVPKVAAPTIHADTIRTVTRVLSSDAFEGRAPSTRAEDLTITYIIKRFKDAGLKPGNNGQWLQEVPTVEITAGNVSPLAVKVGGQTLNFAYGPDMVAGSFRITPKTTIADAELVFVGYGINAPELGWNDYAGLDMKGKIAVILVNDPDYAIEGEAGLFKGRRMTYYGRWTYKFEEAARQGARAALIVHDTFPAAYGWKVVNSGWSGPQHFVESAGRGMDQTEANGWIRKGVAEGILKASGRDLAELTKAAGQKGFRAVPLGATASLSFDNTIRRSTSRNVVGILPGKKRPDEVVLYTAHWDHLGRCTADKSGDDICNGAIDNATGIGAMVAIAEAQAKAGAADRSQVFLAVTLEESGLLGSEYYARNPIYPLHKTVAGVNMDALIPGSPARDVQVLGGDKSELTRYLRAATAAMGITPAAENRPEQGMYYRSDHFSLAKRGVPMFYLKRGTDWIKGGKAAGQAAADDYYSGPYHQPSDEYRDDWDWSGLVQDATLYYRLGRSLAMSREWPNWYKTDEFRAARDQSRGTK